MNTLSDDVLLEVGRGMGGRDGAHDRATDEHDLGLVGHDLGDVVLLDAADDSGLGAAGDAGPDEVELAQRIVLIAPHKLYDALDAGIQV